jgi:phospholipid/cholesterol/gamma-HCH transport system substrate-binding protein
MQSRFKFRYVNELTGLFVLGVCALVIIGIIFSGHSQRWFSRKYAFDVLLPEAGTSGLRRGDEVFILGVAAGSVDDVVVGDDGRMKAHVKIRRDFERFVRTDSTAFIKKAFAVAGDSFMEITRGTGRPLPASHPSIVCLPSEDSLGRIEKMLADLSAEVIPIIKKTGGGIDKWDQLGGSLQTNQAQLTGIFMRLDRLAAMIEEGKGTAGKLINDPEIADDAQDLLVQAKETMGGLQNVVTNLTAAAQDVRNGTVRLPEITEAIANEAKDLPGLVHQTHVSMVELDRLIEAIQRHWIVRKYVDRADPAPLRSAKEMIETQKTTRSVRRSPRESAR